VRGAVYDITQQQLSQGKNSYGVSAIVGVQCRYDALVCGSKAVFCKCALVPFRRELMTERIYSERLNRYTTVDRSRAQELRKEFKEEYLSQLELAVSGITLNHHDCCVECAAQVEWKEARL
jgi:hypothetical protein